MLITHEREKLIQAIVFFAKSTNSCGKIKLFKLLYFLDFEHYKITGRSVTGLKYHAWRMGPVPTSLYDELDSPDPDFVKAVQVGYLETSKRPMLALSPRNDFDPSLFSKRELKIMEGLAKEYYDTNAEDMIEASHLENEPWDRVFNKEARQQEEIPYEYALRADEKEEMLGFISEREALIEALH